MGKEIFELIAPCHFGMEAVLKREINDLGYEISKVENGKVTFLADAEGICRGNIFLRTTERILLKVAEFKAETFDELFEACKAIPWEHYIPENGKFWVTKATSVNSKLFSPSDIQRIVKKAMVESLKRTYRVSWFAEDGASYPLRINIMKDIVTVSLDTTGVSLHKRGYRRYTAPAPVTETLAAAMLLLSPWKKDRILVDPFCGSGTIPIEAAMIACRIAPGLNREFLSEEWDNLIPKKEWYGVVEMRHLPAWKTRFISNAVTSSISARRKNTVLSFPIRRTASVFPTKNRWRCCTAASVRSSKKMIRGHFSC